MPDPVGPGSSTPDAPSRWRVRAATRAAALTAAVVAALTLVPVGIAGAAKDITLDDACTIATTKQIRAAFGRPVSTGEALQGGFACRYVVGDPAAPTGTFTAIQFYPNVLASDAPSAPLQVEDTRAIDQLSGHTLRDVDLGKAAYLNSTKRDLTVAFDRDFGIVLNWTDTRPGELSAKDAKKLIAIAKQIAKRVPSD